MARTVPHSYLRTLELEGTFPQDAGCWHSTHSRLEYGEGIFLPSDPRNDVPLNPDGSFPKAPRFDPDLLFRPFYYRPVRTFDECRLLFLAQHPVTAAFFLTRSWLNNITGQIDPPNPGEEVASETHSVMLFPDLRRRDGFLFPNSWGESWGRGGWGYMPKSYFDAYCYYVHCTHLRAAEFATFRERRIDARRSNWSATDAQGINWYCLGTSDGTNKPGSRIGWAFASAQDNHLDVHELYVRPEWRRQGIGRELSERIRSLAAKKGLPVRLLVMHGDTVSESPGTQPAMLAVVRRLGLRFRKTHLRWAAYMADPLGTSEFPIEPDIFPNRPRSTPEYLAKAFDSGNAQAKEVIRRGRPDSQAMIAASFGRGKAAAVSLAMGVGLTALAHHGASPEGRPEAAVTISQNHADYSTWFPTPGTPEWGVMNRKRGELIRKHSRGLLTPEELPLYELLQRKSEEALDQHFPITPR